MRSSIYMRSSAAQSRLDGRSMVLAAAVARQLFVQHPPSSASFVSYVQSGVVPGALVVIANSTPALQWHGEGEAVV